MITLELPWAPSVNHYYRHVGHRVLVSKDGRNYRERVALRIQNENLDTLTGDVELRIQLYPPDNRRRDVDNVLKVILDTLTIGKLYQDDSQVRRLAVEKLQPMPPDGLIIIRIKEIENIVSA